MVAITGCSCLEVLAISCAFVASQSVNDYCHSDHRSIGHQVQVRVQTSKSVNTDKVMGANCGNPAPEALDLGSEVWGGRSWSEVWV